VGYCSLHSCWLWSCRVAEIFRVAMYAIRTFVVSSRRGFCVGGLPVDIWALSNAEVYGRPIEGEMCEVCVYVCTHVFIQPSMLEGSCCVRYGSSISQFS
jgi:hypothetical protein